MSSPEVFPVSPSALPESAEEWVMTAISGMRCSEQYERSDQLGSLVRMLLVSSQWYSPVRRLEWRSKRICSEKISRISEQSDKNMSSKPSVEILSERGIQSNRLLFQLVPLEHRIDEIGCGLLPTVQTQGLKTCNSEGKSEFVKAELLPTPDCSDRRSDKSCQWGLSNYARNNPLPTPTASTGTRGGQQVEGLRKTRQSGVEYSSTLNDLATSGLLPTPKAQEARGNTSVDRGKMNLSDGIAKRYKPAGKTSQLSHRFVAEMMGFPTDWTELPFLNSEQSPSKDTEMP